MAILSLDSHPGHISAGLAVGVFISFTPFYGLHLVMALVASFMFRLNKITCITGTWVNNPFTVVPVTVLSYKLGRILLGLPPARIHIRELDWHFVKSHATSLILGSSILGFAAAVSGLAFVAGLHPRHDPHAQRRLLRQRRGRPRLRPARQAHREPPGDEVEPALKGDPVLGRRHGHVLSLRYAAQTGVWILCRCTVQIEGDLIRDIEALEGPWSVDPSRPPLRIMKLSPDCNPAHRDS